MHQAFFMLEQLASPFNHKARGSGMKISATDFNGKDVRVSIEAENHAEYFQLRAIMDQLDTARTDWTEWDNMEGRNGICIVAKKKP
jgi:hypothetical protein